MSSIIRLFWILFICSFLGCGSSSAVTVDTGDALDSEITTPSTVSLSLSTATIFEITSRNVQLGSDIDGEVAGDGLGESVSLSSDGQVIAVGGVGNDDGGTDAGYVSVYTWSGTAWVQRGDDINGASAGEWFGRSNSLSDDGTILAVGAHSNDTIGINAGTTRVYHWNGTSWVQRGSDIGGEAAGDLSGFTVALSGDGTILAISAPFNDGSGTDLGHIRVYHWNGTTWVQRGLDIDGEATSDSLGYGLSLSNDGETLAAGAPFNDGAASSAGHARVYDWNGTAWIQRGLDLDGTTAVDWFGHIVSLSNDGDTLAVGVPFDDGLAEDAGTVRIYDWSGTAWVQRGDDIDGEAAGDLSYSVSISSDGDTVLIGALANDGSGEDAGHARAYTWSGTAWTQRATDIDGESVGDSSGLAVSISDNGAIMAIGATSNDGAGNNAGHVRVYQYESLSSQSVLTATLNTAATGNVVITITPTGTATGAGDDYTLSSTTITIPQGQTTGTVTITGISDLESDNNETVILTLSSVTGAVTSETQQVTITIDEG